VIDQNQVQRLLEFLSVSKKIRILFTNTQQQELLLAILATYLFLADLASLKKTKFNSAKLGFFSSAKIEKSFESQASLKKYLKKHQLLELSQEDLGRDNLLISFPYQPEQVDKVSYHIGEDNQRFYLTVKPKVGSEPLDSQQVEFSYTGSSADLLLLIGVNELEDLQDLYSNHQQLYQSTPIITINSFLPDFGTLNLDISGSSGYGEAIFYLIKSLSNLLEINLNDLPRIKQIATLLFASIDQKTNKFTSSKMTADSFLVVAELLKLGAERLENKSETVDNKTATKKTKKTKKTSTN
jgi:hypothetical protein